MGRLQWPCRARVHARTPLLSGAVLILLLARAASGQADAEAAALPARRLDPTYRPPPVWGCEAGLQSGAFHVVVATYAPEPMSLIPWIWNLGLSGAEIHVYHRLDASDPLILEAAKTFAAFEPYPCGSRVLLQQLLPNKGREAAVYMSHIVRHYAALPEGLVLVHDHGPAARHSLCGPFFRRVRGYYAGIREQRRKGGRRLLEEEGGGALAAVAAGQGLGGGNGSWAEGAAEGGAPGGGRRSLQARRKGSGTSSKSRALLARFAEQVVSLSSGCQENWLKGCCALLVCAEDGEQYSPGSSPAGEELHVRRQRTLLQGGLEGEDAGGLRRPASKHGRGRCPFKTSRCLANNSAIHIPVGLGDKARTNRWLYMHGGGGLYDTRYENLVVLHGETPEAAAAAATAGLSNFGFGPLSLVRYAGAAAIETVRSKTSASRNLDYPEASVERSKTDTYAELGRILQEHDFVGRKAPGNFKSCCASLMLRPHHIRHWPLKMYEQILSYTLDGKNSYHASLAVSHHGWSMWAGIDVGPADLLRYYEVDLTMLHIRGCPGWKMVVDPPAS